MLVIAAERGLDILSARQRRDTAADNVRHFLFAFRWLLISVSDSADVREIRSHWVGCAPFFFYFVFLPVPVSSSPASPLLAISLLLS